MEKNVPKLRFPEYKELWDKKKLNQVATFINGKAYKQEELLESGKYPVLRVGNFFSNSSWYYSDLELDKDKYCEYGDLLYAWSASFGPKIWDGHKTIYHYHIWKVVCSQEILKKYLFYILDEQTLKMKTNSSNGFALLHITKGTIENWVVTIPTLPEQTKIANFLTAVDTKISKLKKKKELLEQYKKGVMQQIFSQQLRFKDDNGEDFAEWEEKKLGEVLIKNSIKNKGQKYSLVQSVSNKYGFINQDEMFEDRRVASKDTSNYYIIEKGCFAYNPSRIDVGSLAYKDDDVISVISPLYITFKTNSEFLTDEFLLNWFSTEQFIMQMNSSFEGSVRNTLSYESLSKMDISIPTLPEQTKIANFLSAIDDKIYHCGMQIEKMEGWKKGLLQGMFV